MEYIVGIFIFCLILFIYLHVTFQLRTSDDLEVYELDNVSKNKLEEVCDIRQPVLFDYYNDAVTSSINIKNLEATYPSFEVKIRNMDDFGDGSYLPLHLNAALKLVNENKNKYYSESNTDFLHETGVVKHMKYNDEYIRPYMVSNCNYDIMFGTNETTTPFRYELNYRNYFYVTQGEIIVKLAPPKSSKYLAEYNDYENFEFRSAINPWNVAQQHKADFDKIKCLEVKITPGKIIFIPAYWWYSIKFGENALVATFKYRTYMNNIAISPKMIMYFLQNQNIKRDTIKKANVSSIQTDKSVIDENTENTENNEKTEKNDQ